MERTKIAKDETRLAGEAAVRSHIHKRMDRMALMGLSVVRLIELAGIKQPVLSSQGATLQAGKGSRAEAGNHTDAAHNLPRDVVIADAGTGKTRSFWQWAEDLRGVHPRIKLQLHYSSAATMTVWREANYLDSRWEQSELPSDWVAYLKDCVRSCVGTGGGTLGHVIVLANQFKRRCDATLAETIALVRQRAYFANHQQRLADIITVYEQVVAGYAPATRLEKMWHIYHSQTYA